MRYKSKFSQRSQKRQATKKKPVFDICEGAPHGLQTSLSQEKLVLRIDRAPFMPKKIWRKKAQSNLDQGLPHLSPDPQL